MQSLFDLALDPTAWIALAALVAMEIVLGIDNLIFIAVLTNGLPPTRRDFARRIGLGLAAVLRLMLLGTVAIVVRLTTPVLTLFGQNFSWRDFLLIGGGLFLVWKATNEIHQRVEPGSDPHGSATSHAALGTAAVIGQIVVLDIIFSIDSIITAVGMTEHLPIMMSAIVIAVGTMFFAAKPLSDLIGANPTIVMLALGFLLMIGMALLADGFGVHVPKGYIYAAMAFSALVETLNVLERKARKRRSRRRQSADDTA